jgi:hypothetical protein
MSRHVIWRDAEERDLPALKEMHAEMERKIGKKMDCPNLLTEPVVHTVVAEVDGVIVQGLFAEAELEVCACAPHVLGAKEMEEGVRMLEATAAKYKIRVVRCFVPQQLVPARSDRREWTDKPFRRSAIERMLLKLGFTREKPGFQQFFRWL